MNMYGGNSYHSVEIICPRGHTHDQVQVLGQNLFGCIDCDHIFDDPQMVYFINSIVSDMLNGGYLGTPSFSTKN